MTSARPGRRHGNGNAVEASSIKKVKEICKECTDEDAQAALVEHNGDVQAAVMSLLDNPFQPVEKKKRKPQTKNEREERQAGKDFSYRESGRRGNDRNRGGGGRGRGGDRSYDTDVPPGRGRGRGGRGRGRGTRETEQQERSGTEVTAVEAEFGSEAAAFSPPAEYPTPTNVQRLQSAAVRPVPTAVVSDGSVSWASKVKERTVPVQSMFEADQSSDFEDRSFHDSNKESRNIHANGISSDQVDSEVAQAMGTPQADSFGSGYGHEAQGNSWENAHQTPAWSTAVAPSPELPETIPLQEPLDEPPHQTFEQPAAAPLTGAPQSYPDSKPFDLRDLGGSLPTTTTVPEDPKPADLFEIPGQDAASQPPGFGPPGLQQGSSLNMFSSRNRSTSAADAAAVVSEPRDSALLTSTFADFSHGMAPVSMPPTASQSQHHVSSPVQQSHMSSTATAPPGQQQASQEMVSAQSQPSSQNQQEPSTQQSTASQLAKEAHSQHPHSFQSQFGGHVGPESHRGAPVKGSAPNAMFLSDATSHERVSDANQAQAGAQNSQDQDKAYSGAESKGQNSGSDQQHQPLPHQPYQQIPQEVNNWGMPGMQADLYSMQRPGSGQLTPPGMQGMVPGMGQIPNQMQAQYHMNPNIPAPAYGAPGYPTHNYHQQLGYAPGPYMQPGYSMQYANSGYHYGQMGPQAYAPSPSGPQMYGGPNGSFPKQAGYMGDYSARGAPASGAAGLPATSGRGRGRGKNQKGRMPSSFTPQGGMHADPYNSSQGGYMDPNWVSPNQRFDNGYGKDSKGAQHHYAPPFNPGGYDNPPYAYGQFAQHSQFPQQAWNGQEKGMGGGKGNF